MVNIMTNRRHLVIIITIGLVTAITMVSANSQAQSLNSNLYSCDLQNNYSKCIEYPIDKSFNKKILVIKENCEAFPGAIFRNGACPKSDFVAECKKIKIDNHENNDFMYSRFYYLTGMKPWDKEKVERVCGDLGGSLSLNEI